MLNDIYKVDGKYPDPYEIEERLKQLKTPSEYRSAIAEIRSAGLDKHPLLKQFSVES
jgi:hypothetical protein